MCLDRKNQVISRLTLCTFLALVCFILLCATGLQTAAQSTNDAPRRIKVAVKPEYSALAKRLNLSGVVRVEVQIGADGKVKKAHVIGGHPVLAIDAEKAALMTEFEPAAKESAQIIEFHIGPAS